MREKLYLGIDAGSTTLKAVLLTDNGKVRHSMYQRTRPSRVEKLACTGRCAECGACSLGTLRNAISDFLSEAGTDFDSIDCTVVTGSQISEDTRRTVPFDFKVSEVSAHVAGATHYHPNCRAILDVGGQDSKAMVYKEDMGLWLSKMSGICAAGTGAFLDSVAQKLGIPTEEMARLANYDSELEFSSVCAVLSATSVNKFKSRMPIGDIIGGACRAQARTIMSGVGELLIGYKGDIFFQGGVAYNNAVSYYLKELTGNEIIVPRFHSVMGALGAAVLAMKHAEIRHKISFPKSTFDRSKLLSLQMRASQTRSEFLIRSNDKEGRPLVWRNLFYPPEILNAFGARILTLETYAALFARNQKRIKKHFDQAAFKGFSAETCSFLRVLEGIQLPPPAFALSTSDPCQQGERIFRDLAHDYNFDDRFYSVSTPGTHDALSVEQIAQGLERSVELMEKATGRKLDKQALRDACEISNETQVWSEKCNALRLSSPPLIPGSVAVYYAALFSQNWGKPELREMYKQFYTELEQRRHEVESKTHIDQTHRALWLHLPPFYDTSLLEYIENHCHVPIVFEEVNYTGWVPLDSSDPYRALARKLLSTGYLDADLRVKTIVETCKKGQINGAFIYNHGFGRCSMADATFIKQTRAALAAARIPLIVLDGDCMDSSVDPCSTTTKIESFAESLNSARYGNLLGPVGDTKIERILNRLPQDSRLKEVTQKAVERVAEKVSEIRKRVKK